MDYGLSEDRLSREPFTCEMCKEYYVGQYRYIYNTFQISRTPTTRLIICEKCAVRESKFKNKQQLNKYYEK